MKKKILAMVMMTAMLVGLAQVGLQVHAIEDQSITFSNGYRLYVDEMTPDSGIIKADTSAVKEDQSIESVILPDGSSVAAEEVNYPVSESSEYTFEVIYEASQNDEQPKVNNEILTSLQSSQVGIQADSTMTDESNESNQTLEMTLEQAQETVKTEKMTLNVVLPIPVIEQEQPVNTEQDVPEAEQKKEQISTEIKQPEILDSLPSVRSASYAVAPRANTGSWDSKFDYYGSRLNWTRGRFNTYTTYYGSTGGMDFIGNDQALRNGFIKNHRQGAPVNYALTKTESPPTFRYGYELYHDSTYDWVQYSHGFSDISLDLSKDFAVAGNMIIGSEFGKNDTNSEGAKDNRAGIGQTNGKNNGLSADGGLTISLLPENRIDENILNAGNGLSGVQRLGAYGAFKNAIVMEFDVGHQNGYGSITGADSASFTITDSSKELQRVGDWKIDSADLNGLELQNYSNDFYDKNQKTNVATTSHIGISLTNNNGYVDSASLSSPRKFIFGNDTGSFDYKIEYNAASKKMTYSLKRAGNASWQYSVSLTLPNSYAGKKYRLASSFSAIYQHYTYYTNGTYFNGATNADDFPNNVSGGQMQLTIQGIYSQPDLSTLNDNVWYINKYTGSVDAGIKAYANGYVSNSDNADTQLNKRKTFPVEGDTVTIQNEANIKSLFNGQGYADNSTQIYLKEISFGDLQFVDANGNEIGIPSALNIDNINDIKVRYFYSTDGGGTWRATTKTDSSFNEPISNASGLTTPLRFRAVITLPQTKSVTNSTDKQFWLTGNIVLKVNRGGTNATFNLPLLKQNNKRLTFFSDPKDVGANGLNKSTARVIKSTDGITELQGNQMSNNKTAVSYGVNVWYNSTQKSEPYNPSYESQDQTYSHKSISDILNNNPQTNVDTTDQNIALQKDTRYVVKYSMYDSQFNSDSSIKSLAGNQDRAKASTTRVIWNSDNVTVGSGYEFYMLPEVTMSVKDFDGFVDAPDKGDFYRKIAKAADVSVFKTTDANWSNLARNSDMTIASTISGNGKDHEKVNKLINNPGSSDDITIQFFKDGTYVYKTVKLTLTSDLPKVVSTDGTLSNQMSEKIIFDRENYKISATFKLVKNDGTDIDINDLNWEEVKEQIHVALYKKNGPKAGASKDKFYRWANKIEADDDGKDTNTSTPKLNLPVDLKLNNDGTFTVTYTLLNSGEQSSNSNWVQKTWEDGAQWRIYAWTDTNAKNLKYDVLSDNEKETVAISEINQDIASATTTIHLIEKENGNLPTDMFVISNVKLIDDGTDLTDHRPTTTISLKDVDNVADKENAEHDYYYEVSVDDSVKDTNGTPYVEMKQTGTNRTFNATYQRYDDMSKSYTDITEDNLTLGSIAYLSDKNSLPQSIRFGMCADRQNDLTSDAMFTGTGKFKFVRKSFGSGGDNP